MPSQFAVAPAGAPSPAQQTIAANLAARQQFIARSLLIRRTLAPVPIVAGQSAYPIALNNQGALLAVDLEFTINFENGAVGVANFNFNAPWSFISNINFVGQDNIARHSLPAADLYDYLNFTGLGARAPFGMQLALSGNSPNSSIAVVNDPTMVSGIAINTAATVKFWLHFPIAKSPLDTRGMVMLQTGNNNQPAIVNVTLTNKLAGTGDAPYNQAITITGGTILAHQIYYQPQSGAVEPPIDTLLQWSLTGTGNDSTNLSVGQSKQILLQTQFPTSTVGIRYYNGLGYGGFTDFTSILLKTLGGTMTLNDDSPEMYARRYIRRTGTAASPNMLWWDFSAAPLIYATTGIVEVDIVPAVVNATAYTTQLYDWLKLPPELANVPGAAQV